MLENGFIKLYRSLLKWEWYDDINTKTVFLHLLLTVSIEDSKWHGIEVKRGSRVASYEVLARETKLTVKQLRTAINHLEATGEVARYKHPKFTVFSINNYDKFQSGADITASKGQSEGNVTARKGQQYKKVKESKRKQEYIYYGEFSHVKLTTEQYQKLIDDFGETTIRNYIQKIDEWIQLKGKSPYKDFNLAIRKWLNRDGVKKEEISGSNIRTYEEYI